jgi:hypothetical protein
MLRHFPFDLDGPMLGRLRRLAVSFATHALRILTLALLAGLSMPLAAQTQTPFTGMPIALPGTIEAENFDNGGEGVAYHDNVPGNAGGQYRTGESVDIIVTRDAAGGGYSVNNFDTGEWLAYTVNIQAAGQYEIAIRTANGGTTATSFRVEIDGNNVTGTVSVPPTGGWSAYQWVAKRGVSLPAGQHVLKLVSELEHFDVNQIRVTATPTTPFAGVIALPGIFEAENFDNGGQDISYSDTTAANDGGQFRTTDAVDIITSRDPDDAGAGYNVNGFHAGEWMVYTVSVANSGLYDIEARVATGLFANAAFHIEIDGVNVTGSMMPGATGNFGTYTWFKKPSVQLSAGQHVLKLVSEQEIADVNRIRVTAVTHTPFGAGPISLPGIFEAEHFDNGGEGNAYHDMTATNDGGAQFRLNEGVDIKPSRDPDGGTYVVNNFQTGEWLAYTVNVAQAGNYDIELRLASGTFTTGAFHVEIDEVNVTQTVSVPPTGSFGTFQWFGKKNVPLPAGQHTLKLVSEGQFFDVNQIRVVPATTQYPAELLFLSGFEQGVSLSAITRCDGSNCYQNLVGGDVPPFSWPPQIPGGGNHEYKMRAGNNTNPQPTGPNAIGNWIVNDFQTVTGHTGASTRALHNQINKNCFGHTNSGQEGCSTQDPYQLQPTSEPSPDMYISFWRKLEPSLLTKLTSASTDNWNMVFEWKTTADLRIAAQIVAYDPGQAPYWQITKDNFTNGDPGAQIFWRCPNDGPTLCGAPKVRIPSFDNWFKFEVFWHRSTGNDGRIWMAVNGVVIVDRFGPNKITDPINRIFLTQLYMGVGYPVSQWTDDVQIWSKVPVEGVDTKPGDPWFDPPYGLR